MDQWLNQIFDMSRELIIANRLAVVTKTLVKECIAEARLFCVSQTGAPGRGRFLTCVRQQHSQRDTSRCWNEFPIRPQDAYVLDLWTQLRDLICVIQ